MKKENKNDQIASIIFVLHAHLPFVNHPASSSFLEENWFFEAVAETYVPLIKMCERLASANIRPPLTLSISPTLAAMLCNKELQSKIKNYILSRQELLKKEKTRVRGEHLLRNTIAIY